MIEATSSEESATGCTRMIDAPAPGEERSDHPECSANDLAESGLNDGDEFCDEALTAAVRHRAALAGAAQTNVASTSGGELWLVVVSVALSLTLNVAMVVALSWWAVREYAGPRYALSRTGGTSGSHNPVNPTATDFPAAGDLDALPAPARTPSNGAAVIPEPDEPAPPALSEPPRTVLKHSDESSEEVIGVAAHPLTLRLGRLPFPSPAIAPADPPTPPSPAVASGGAVVASPQTGKRALEAPVPLSRTEGGGLRSPRHAIAPPRVGRGAGSEGDPGLEEGGGGEGFDDRGLPIPDYPAEARRRGEQGLVEFDVQILPDGSVGEVHVVTDPGFPRLVEAAAAAVRRANKFEPATRDGEPVAGHLIIPFRFELK